jgi:quinol monooxygenase YgiN
VIETNSPVLRKEFNNVGYDTSVKSACEWVEVVFVKTYEWPETLKNHLFMTHICHWVNQANAIECESNVVAFTGLHIQVVAH